MKILNIMLSRDLGGVQQSFLDYSKMLLLENITVINITSHFAEISKYVDAQYKLPNLGNWDIISTNILKGIIQKENPDAIIAHGGRATKFSINAAKAIPIIGVVHSDELKLIEKCTHIFTLTNKMEQTAIKRGIAKDKLSVLPNTIDTQICGIIPKDEFSSPPIIGTMARFVQKKGIDTFLESLSILKKEGVQFKAVIGGGGEEEDYYKSLSINLGLEHYVEFTGWVENKADFFNKIDIFCLPSHNEPFGIILLEAMGFKKPIITTATSGPSEIVQNDKEALIVEIGNPNSMAEAIISLIHNEGAAKHLAQNALTRSKKYYDIRIIAKNLKEQLTKIIDKYGS